jgi:DNA-binding response OmpR family regulator
MNRVTRILIVDDEPNVRLVFRTALEPVGHAVDEAGDGHEALRSVAEYAPDLMLLDLHMPHLDGMTTLRRLREGGSDVPVVIVTAHGNVPNAVEAMKLGAIDFLQKPLTPEQLREAVADILARHAAPPEPSRRSTPEEGPVTVTSQFAANLARAKRALNNRWFEEAEVYLRQAIALKPDSAEAHNHLGVLHELSNEHDASYREYKAALKADRHYAPAEHNMTRYYERFTFGRSEIPVDTGE